MAGLSVESLVAQRVEWMVDRMDVPMAVWMVHLLVVSMARTKVAL